MFPSKVDKQGRGTSGHWLTAYAVALCLLICIGGCADDGGASEVADPVEEGRAIVEAHIPAIESVLAESARRQAVNRAIGERLSVAAAQPFAERVEGGLRYSTVFERTYGAGDWPLAFVDGDGLTARGEAVLAVIDKAPMHAMEVETFHRATIASEHRRLQEANERAGRQALAPTAAEVEVLVALVSQRLAEAESAPREARQVVVDALADLSAESRPALSRLARFHDELAKHFAPTAATMAALELAVADGAMRYAREMRHKNLSRVDWRQMRDAGGSAEVIYGRLIATLEALVAAEPDGVEATFRDLEPPHPQYRKLVAATAEHRQAEGDADELARMELTLRRWRESHLAGEEDFILVNIPGYQAEVWTGGRRAMEFDVVVGKSRRRCDEDSEQWVYPDATPVVMSTMDHIMLNPPWYVPDRLRREVLEPRREENPDYFEESGYEEVELAGGTKAIRQRPGPDNALGKAKFIFPNEYNVYLHDTPHKQFFDVERRAYSHGCVRVAEPVALARHLVDWLGRDDLDVDELLASGRTIKVSVDKPLPVIIEYYTVWIDDAGQPQFLEDIYARDARRLSDDPDGFGRCQPRRTAIVDDTPNVEGADDDLGP